MELAQNRRGEFKDMRYLVQGRTTLHYEMPLAEMVTDFFDHMKSRSKGYASMEYSLIDYRENDLVKLDVSVNGEPVDALSFILHRSNAYDVGPSPFTVVFSNIRCIYATLGPSLVLSGLIPSGQPTVHDGTSSLCADW